MKLRLVIVFIILQHVIFVAYVHGEEGKSFCADLFNNPKTIQKIFKELGETRSLTKKLRNLHRRKNNDQPIAQAEQIQNRLDELLNVEHSNDRAKAMSMYRSSFFEFHKDPMADPRLQPYTHHCHEVASRTCFNILRALYTSYKNGSPNLEQISGLSASDKEKELIKCDTGFLTRVNDSKSGDVQDTGAKALTEDDQSPPNEASQGKRTQIWRLMSVGPDFKYRICIDEHQRNFFRNHNSFINLAPGESCNAFETTPVANENPGFSDLQSLMTSFIGSQGAKIDDFMSMNGNDRFCNNCFSGKYTAAQGTRDPGSKPQESESTPKWITLSDQNIPFEEFRDEAKSAISNYLVENIAKQEFLKLSVVMEQFAHAKALDSTFPHEADQEQLSCNNPDGLMTEIKNKCGDQRIFNSEIMGQRIRNIFSALGVPKQELNSNHPNNKWGLATGLEHILNKVNTVTSKDGFIGACSSVNRVDVAKFEQRSQQQSEANELFKGFFSALISSDQGDSILNQFRNSSASSPQLQTIEAQQIMGVALASVLKNDTENNSAIRKMLTDPNAIPQAQRDMIQQAIGISLPLNLSDPNANQVKKLTGASIKIFISMSRYNPNLFMFINSPEVRSYFSQDKESLIENLFDSTVSQEAFKIFSQRCNDSFKKIAQVICTNEGNLDNFSKTDIAVAAQEISDELKSEDPKRRDLAIIALGSEVCMQKLNNNHANTPQYLDLDQQLPTSFAQSDFMRSHKRPHEFETSPELYTQYSAEERAKTININKDNRVLDESNNKSEYFCDKEAVDYVTNETECLNHQRNCGEFKKQVQDDETYYNTHQAILASSYSSKNPSSKSSSKGPSRLERLLNQIQEKRLSNQMGATSPNNNRSQTTTESIKNQNAIASEENSLTNPLANTAGGALTSPLPSRAIASVVIEPESSDQTSNKQDNIQEVSKHGNLGQHDLNKLSIDELAKMAEALRNRQKSSQSADDSNDQMITQETQRTIDDLINERKRLRKEREKIDQARSTFSQNYPSSSPSQSASSGSSSQAVTAVTPNIPGPPGSITTHSSSQGPSATSSAGNTKEGNLSATSKRSNLVLYVRNPDKGNALPSYLAELKKYGLESEPDYINFKESPNGTIIEVPGPNGKVLSYNINDLDEPLKQQIMQIIALRKGQNSSTQLSPSDRRPVMQVLAEREEKIINKESEIENRLGIYQEFLRVLE